MAEQSNLAEQFDVIVIGAGPGGYVAAIRAAQNGMKVACVEREYLGGTCLNVGCIPSKAMLDSSERYHYAKNHFARHGLNLSGEIQIDLKKMLGRKDEVVKGLTTGVGFLFKKNKIAHLMGHGKIAGAGKVEVKAADGSTRTYGAKHILIATGSAPVQIPGFAFDEKMVCSSTGGLTINEIPKKMVVVGGGYIGVELGSVWARLGSEVIVLEFLDRILPTADKEMAAGLQKSLTKLGLNFRFGARAKEAKVEGNKVRVSFEHEGKVQEEVVDRVLVSVGRKPVTDNLGLDTVGVQTDKRGFIPVDAHFKTTAPGVYAIGDVIGGIMLAHKAEEEGVACADLIAGKSGHVNYDCCPAVVYTHPELAQVGLTEEQARERGEIKVGKFQFVANGRAKGMDETEGFVKVIADARTDRLLGVHILGAHASDMIHEAVAVMEFHGSAEDMARLFHAHPTLPEAIKEAALAVDKRAIHA
jgi:dihydrolipoamide dehydrogenase